MSDTCAEHLERERTAFCVGCGKALCDECVVKYAGRPMCAACVEKQVANMAPSDDAPVAKRAPSTPVGGMLAKAQPVSSARKKVFAESGALKIPAQAIVGKLRAMDIVWGREPRRIVARLVDAAVVILPSFPISMGLAILTSAMFSEVRGFGSRLCFYITLTVVASAYFIVAEWKYGKTIGKHLVGLRVVRKDGYPTISLFQSMWRWMGFLAAFVWSLTGWWIASKIWGWMVFIMEKSKIPVPAYLPRITLLISTIIFTMFSLGLLMTFIGKYKRGFHDLLGDTAVMMDNK